MGVIMDVVFDYGEFFDGIFDGVVFDFDGVVFDYDGVVFDYDSVWYWY